MDGKIFFILAVIIILLYLTTQVESFHGHRYHGGGRYYGGRYHRYRGHPGYYYDSPYYGGWCPWWDRSCINWKNWGPGGRYWW